jgi:hypothetical protein
MYGYVVFIKLMNEKYYISFNGTKEAGKFLEASVHSISKYDKTFRENKNYVFKKKCENSSEFKIIQDLFIIPRTIEGVIFEDYIKIYKKGLSDAGQNDEQIKEKINNFIISLKPADETNPEGSLNPESLNPGFRPVEHQCEVRNEPSIDVRGSKETQEPEKHHSEVV